MARVEDPGIAGRPAVSSTLADSAAATSARAAAMASGPWMSSTVPSPPMKLMPVVFAMTQPPRAAPEITTPRTAPARTRVATRAYAPHASWARASTANARAACSSSAWMPIAAAWMAPAPSEAKPARASGPMCTDAASSG